MFAKQRTRRDKPRSAAPAALMNVSDCAVRFLLAAVLSGAEILEGYSFFALAFVGASRPGSRGLAALLGCAFGYLSFRGVVEGLRYISAAMMVYAVALALGEFNLYRKVWFMPAASALINGLVGFVYRSAAGWEAAAIVGFATEVTLTAGLVYFYRLAFDALDTPRLSPGVTQPQLISLLVLGATVTLTLARVTVGPCSLGRILCALAVMIAGWKGGIGTGAAAGVAAGLAVDLAGGILPQYTLLYAFPGLVCGIFSGQGKLLPALGYLLSAGAAMLWSGGPWGIVYESLVSTILFLILPDKLLRRLAALIRHKSREEGQAPRHLAARQLGKTAEAFRALSDGLAGAFPRQEADPTDSARIFDRAAERVCARCRMREKCWQQEYQSTRTALNDALGPMLDRGEGVREDFPGHFAGRCIQLEAFLRAVNRELTALLCRRRYDCRVWDSRAAVCAQYGQLAAVLDRTAAELSREPAVDVPRLRLVKQRMAALGLEGSCTLWNDEYGHLRLEITGAGTERLTEPVEVARLSSLLGCPLKAEDSPRGSACFRQKEPLMAVAGVAAANREGQSVSGDSGAWFKDESGRLHVLLCDGMGSGPAAREESSRAMELLEKFLRADLPPEEALTTVGQALALRGEEGGGFTTVDLLLVDLFTGEGAVYKLGGAPTYLRRGDKVERLEGSALPAGLAPGRESPDRFPIRLEDGDWVVMVSDGVTAGKGDSWLREAVAAFDQTSPQALAHRILDSGDPADDRTVMVLRITTKA